ncbi:hypothetical protein RND81_02G148800 [Saponaria officinalis]|uniref:Reverse transcriptase zinc-binding domain-containing protein n=1 Tax=Saponaria officinalis TaxID=3572 RepID=A0AAW1MTY3_SAPOF
MTRWIHHIYLKDQDWVEYEPSIDVSWSWRRICKVRDKLASAFTANYAGMLDSYSVKRSYSWFQPDGGRVPWYSLVWNRIVCPKHAFLCWMSVHGRLFTKSRQKKVGGLTDLECYMCGCEYSKKCTGAVNEWIEGRLVNWNNWEDLTKIRGVSMLTRQIYFATYAALIHHIWEARNICRLFQYVRSPNVVLREIQFELKTRVRFLLCNLKYNNYCNILFRIWDNFEK